MSAIQFECPLCHEINEGDESQYGQRVTCRKCHQTIRVPSLPAAAEPPTARLIQAASAGPPPAPGGPVPETEIFDLSPVARAFAGHILVGLIFLGLGIWLALRARDFSWPPQVAYVPAALGVLLLLQVWIRIRACRYRLTTQRLFVRRGWLARHADELELYRVKDVTVDQSVLQRLLGYGTVTVFSDDDTTPRVDLTRIPRPSQVKETIRTRYRAARLREGVRPTEFLQSP